MSDTQPMRRYQTDKPKVENEPEEDKVVAMGTGTRKRLTDKQRSDILTRLGDGERVADLAREFGVSPGAIHVMKRGRLGGGNGGGGGLSSSASREESELRTRLVAFAVATLLRQEIDPDETTDLEKCVREELIQRMIAGL